MIGLLAAQVHGLNTLEKLVRDEKQKVYVECKSGEGMSFKNTIALCNRGNGKFMSIHTEICADPKQGRAVLCWQNHLSACSRWILESVPNTKGEWHWFRCALDPTYFLHVKGSGKTVGTSVHLWDKPEHHDAHWKICRADDGSVSLKNRNNGLFLRAFGTSIVCWDDHESAICQWTIREHQAEAEPKRQAGRKRPREEEEDNNDVEDTINSAFGVIDFVSTSKKFLSDARQRIEDDEAGVVDEYAIEIVDEIEQHLPDAVESAVEIAGAGAEAISEVIPTFGVGAAIGILCDIAQGREIRWTEHAISFGASFVPVPFVGAAAKLAYRTLRK